MVEAREKHLPQIVNWGSGRPRREFLHVDDLAAACVHLMDTYNSAEIVNVGCGCDISIKELAEMVAEAVGYKGELCWDTSQPDGTFQKLLDVSKLEKLGWKASIDLKQGIKETIDWYLNHIVSGDVRI
jgi:GDP-L-fucose synthase